MATSRALKADLADRRAKLVKMRVAGHSFAKCAAALGYSSAQHASRDFSRILEQNIAEQRTSLEVYRETEVLRLDSELERLTLLYEKVETLLERRNVTVSAGQVVRLDGQPLPDDAPFLATVDRLLRIEDARRKNAERRAKLLGLDSAQRLEVLTIDAIDAQVAELSEQLAALDREDREAGAAEDASG